CGGLNLTRAESCERLATRYSGSEMPGDIWPSLLADFDADALRAWAAGLGIETFAASSGRVYPIGLKSARLLRRWLERLRCLGVQIRVGHRWTDLALTESPRRARLGFEAGERETPVSFEADAVLLALGGGSWPRTGSDGQWTGILERLGVAIAPLEPANCGWEVAWSAAVLAQAEGRPIKNIVARAGDIEAAGELLLTRYGLEGSALYSLGPALRALKKEHNTAELRIDFKPTFTVEQLLAKLGTLGKNPANLLPEARTRWRLGEAVYAIVCSQGPYSTPAAFAATVKDCRLFLNNPRPLAEAISSAGGIRWSELTRGLMLRRLPGVFVAGEMIDWEAPTGGYLLQGCISSGTRAAHRALEWMRTGTTA
ncbi:MAG: TIGR03862 family flavoprotein, partial [Chthoniobacteraceae bacterium]|nr:TIGR03862 family flavoprotein [Chthoniobacteraceae bacterium]